MAKHAISDEALAKIKADLERWRAGLWWEEHDYGAACQCGLSERYIEGNKGFAKHGIPTLWCHRHGKRSERARTD